VNKRFCRHLRQITDLRQGRGSLK